MKAKAELIDWEDDNSPNGVVSSMTEEEWKPKRHRLNAKQTQEKSEEDLRMQVKYSRVHKAATKLYTTELDKGKEGMSSRKVDAAIKKKYTGVGPSDASIHHYVVNRGEINMSPQRSNLTYCGACNKSLCAGFVTFMRINQLNCTVGINHQGKMALIVPRL